MLIELLMAAVAVGVGFAVAEGANRIRTRLADTVSASIADFPVGRRAKITGVVRDGRTVAAPITGRPCVAFYAEASAGSAELATEYGGIDFVVDDDTGFAVVDPTGADVDFELDARTKTGFFGEPNELEAAFLERHGHADVGSRVSFREGIVEVGETIAVMGFAAEEIDPAAAPTSYREGATVRIRLRAARGQPLLISDHLDSTRE